MTLISVPDAYRLTAALEHALSEPLVGVLNAVTIAPITRTMRGIASEVQVGPDEGLPEPCVINRDTIASVPRTVLNPIPVGMLDLTKRVALDRALRYALDTTF